MKTKITIILITFLVVTLPYVVNAATIQDIVDQLAKIQAQVVAIQNSNGNSIKFTQNLTVGSTGKEVADLQRMLIEKEYLNIPTDIPLGYFGGLTKSALARWQSSNNISPAVGYWGPISRSYYLSSINSNSLGYADVSKKPSRSGGGSSVSIGTDKSSSNSIANTNMPSSTDQSSAVSDSSVHSMEWGAFAGYSSSELISFEQLVGKPVGIKAIFVNWNDSFPTYLGSDLKLSGKKLLIFWEQYNVNLDDIISGKYDSYIRNFAASAKIYGGEIILAPLHEMNGDWDPWGGAVGSNTPAKVVSTWKKIHDVFGDVSNVKFAWTINNISVPNTPDNAIHHYYPGNSYVDYIGVDGFNFGSPWQSFDQIFGNVLKELAVHGKPMYILSTASADGSQKADWIYDFGIKVKNYPLLRGWVWFNENKERDWRVNSDSAALSAFKSILP